MRRHLCRHLRIHLEQFFEAFGVVAEASADVDAFEGLVVAVVGLPQVFGHGVWFVEVGDGGGEMRLASQQDILGAAGQVGLVLFGELGDGEGVPAEGVF